MSKIITTPQFISSAIVVHGDKYDYSQVEYTKTHNKVVIVCPTHGPFLMRPNDHVSGGQGCRECGRVHKIKTTEHFVDRALSVHGDKYDYSNSIYVDAKHTIVIVCKQHGDFKQKPNDHVSGKTGCPRCAVNAKHTYEQFVNKAVWVHGDTYDYSKVNYIGTAHKVVIGCREHGDFLQTPTAHVDQQQKCPNCVQTNFSLTSISWLNHISTTEQIAIQHALNGKEYLIPGTKRRVDGYCAETNTVYEFHGDFWHGNPNIYTPDEINEVIGKTMGTLYNNTIIKEHHIRSLGYNLVIMWESDWNNLKTKGE